MDEKITLFHLFLNKEEELDYELNEDVDYLTIIGYLESIKLELLLKGNNETENQ